MNDRITAGAAVIMGTLTVATHVSRWWVKPQPPTVQAVLDEQTLTVLLTDGALESNEYANCPAEGVTRFHAVRTDGSRRCWTCSCETPAGVS